jgi:regulator of sigma E protease
LTYVLSFIFVLGVLVFVHELGHFLAAKRVGIRVLKFQLGFNPTILSFRYGETEYGIGALPLGGYVKMAGEASEDGPTGDPREFLSKSRWQRFQVLVMGPTMNLLLAFFLAAAVLYQQGAAVDSYSEQPAVVGVVKPNLPAARADIRPGDLIVTVDGHRVDTWRELSIAIGTRPNREVPIGLLRGGNEVTRKVTPLPDDKSRFEVGDIGVLPNVHPHIAATSDGEPGARGGLKPGDVIVATDGEPTTFDAEFRQLIRKSADTPMTLSILRNGTPMSITVTPRLNGTVGYLGVTPTDDFKLIRLSVLGALKLSAQENVRMAGMIGDTVWGLLSRQLSPKQLMGPIAIAQASGEQAKLGPVALAGLMVMLSLNLGLLNLMPIPMLDGGHILIMALEGLARRDFSVKVKEKVLLAGFVVLMMLMVTVFYNDLSRIGVFDRLIPRTSTSQPVPAK